MFLWCDKYRPECFSDFQFHKEEAKRLKKLISNDNFPHLFIYGPCGSGKRTLVRALLFELFGDSSKKLRIESKIFETPSGKKIEQNFLASNFHLEVNPSQNGFYDRVIIQELIKEVATTSSLSNNYHFKVIVIDDAHCLTREAQQSLRRTLEKYVSTCRVILIAERSSRIIPALKSRCLMLRNSAPSQEEIRKILEYTCRLENLKTDPSTIEEVLEKCNNNPRRALLMLQSIAFNRESLTAATTATTPTAKPSFVDWQQKILEISKLLTKTHSPRNVTEIRSILYDLQIHLIPPDIILRTLVVKLLDFCLDDEMKSRLIYIAARDDHRIAQGSKPIIHLELFCITFMMIFRCSVEKIAFDLEQPMELD